MSENVAERELVIEQYECSVSQAAKVLHLSTRSVRRLIEAGAFDAYRPTGNERGKWSISVWQLLRFQAETRMSNS